MPNPNHKQWTEFEKDILNKAYDIWFFSHRTKYQVIQELVTKLPRRTKIAIESRFNQMVRRHNQRETLRRLQTPRRFG